MRVKKTKSKDPSVDSSSSAARTTYVRGRRDERLTVTLDLIKQGHSIRAACGLSKMPRQTLYDWMNSRPEVRELVDEALDEGLGHIEQKFLAAASHDEPIDWRALSWVLARRFPNEYGQRRELEIKAHQNNGVAEVLAMIEQTNHLLD